MDEEESMITKGDFMFKYKIRIVIIVLLSSLLLNQSKAIDWTSGNYNIPGPEWQFSPSATLNIYNDVSVNMYSDGVVHFNMYDNSELSMYDGGIGILNLYSDSSAKIFGGNPQNIWVDPSSSAWIKIYAHIENIDPQPDSIGRIGVRGTWLANNVYFDIGLLNGVQTINHVQFIPEPATFALISLGSLIVLKKRFK
jgi:hypothetical protein